MREWDLSLIATAMHGDGGFVDPRTGEVRIGMSADAGGGVGDGLGNGESEWITIARSGADADLREMEAFVAAVADPESHTMLDNALSSGAFGGTVMADRELDRAWGRFRDAHRRGAAADWLAEHGLVDAAGVARLQRESDAAARAALAVVNADANAELRGVEALEEELQTPERRGDEAWLAVILADDFEEIGASGRVYSRREALEALQNEASPAIVVHDITSRRLGLDTVLVHWRSEIDGRSAVRTALWRMDPAGWRLVHHQATPVG